MGGLDWSGQLKLPLLLTSSRMVWLCCCTVEQCELQPPSRKVRPHLMGAPCRSFLVTPTMPVPWNSEEVLLPGRFLGALAGLEALPWPLALEPLLLLPRPLTTADPSSD